MKQLLIDIAKSLVEFPDEVKVSEKVSGDVVMYELSVAPTDVGKVIGRQGKIAKSIRTLMRAAAGLENKRVIVDIASE
ncbi:MAG TPA: KH domain-containing protein [Bacillota bacterium]|nr:KH domain-containing protein [Bacillota bacterium]